MKQSEVDIRNEERAKIARELHDILANELLHLQFLLFKTEDQLEKDIFHQLSDRVNYIRKQVRLMSHTLIKPFEDVTGENFIKSVKNVLLEYTYFLPDLVFDFNYFPKDIKVSNIVTTEILIVLKEVFNNASLHGKATNIDINITDHQDNLSILIEDNGEGFNLENNKGEGIKNIKHRIKDINGSVTIESFKDVGTVYNINISKK